MQHQERLEQMYLENDILFNMYAHDCRALQRGRQTGDA
jgi:hypothetical protein